MDDSFAHADDAFRDMCYFQELLEISSKRTEIQYHDAAQFFAQSHLCKSDINLVFMFGEYPDGFDTYTAGLHKNAQSLTILVSPCRIPELQPTHLTKKLQLPESYAWYSKHIIDTPIDLDHKILHRRFLSLNFRARWHRQALLQFLHSHRLQEHFYFSYWGQPMHDDPRACYNANNDVIGNTWFNHALDLDRLFDFLPIIESSSDTFQPNQTSIRDHLYQSVGIGSEHYWSQSFASVITETYFGDNNDPFFTEKTWKALAWGHPFLMIACDGALDLLHHMGFETFGDVFDESYDSIKSPQTRLEHIFREIKRVCDLPSREIELMHKKLIPRLKENQRRFRHDLPRQRSTVIAQSKQKIQQWVEEFETCYA